MSVASKSKLTQKQHTFATHMAAGQMSMAEAYRQSYDAENMKPAVVRNEASKLMAHRDVAMMIKTLRGRIEAAVIAGAVSDAERVKTKLRTMMDSALP